MSILNMLYVCMYEFLLHSKEAGEIGASSLGRPPEHHVSVSVTTRIAISRSGTAS